MLKWTAGWPVFLFACLPQRSFPMTQKLLSFTRVVTNNRPSYENWRGSSAGEHFATIQISGRLSALRSAFVSSLRRAPQRLHNCVVHSVHGLTREEWLLFNELHILTGRFLEAFNRQWTPRWALSERIFFSLLTLLVIFSTKVFRRTIDWGNHHRSWSSELNLKLSFFPIH